MVTPRSKKDAVRHLLAKHKLSERKACALLSLSRTAFRYVNTPRNDVALRKRIKELAAKYPRYGYLMLHALLKKEGLVKNRKRTYRIYTEEGLQARTKKRKKLIRPRVVMDLPKQANERWSMDFVSGQLSNGRRFRILNIVDDYTREMAGQYVNYSISGAHVAWFLDKIAEQRKLPNAIVCNNGTEYTSKAMFFWSQKTTTRQSFIQPGKPTQNAFIESLNESLRNECLNQHWFKSLDDAKNKIGECCDHYNQYRPHSSLKYLSPEEFSSQVA